MHTILGANGVIGFETSKQLRAYSQKVRQVSRNPKKVNDTDELLAANLLNFHETEQAVAGSEVVYLLAGLKYDTPTWQRDWPVLMRNVIDACKKHHSKLVFFDNVYAYGRVAGTMTEETPFNPCSKKGEVRAQIASLLLAEMKANNLTGMIVRGADFYGPGAWLSLTHSMVTDRLKKKKTPQWIGSTKAIHTFTYTPDAGKTLALLGNTPDAFNQTWHALTSKHKITGVQYIEIACRLMNQKVAVQALPKWGVQLLGFFVPVLREFVEMMYQFENDYLFDSTKLENRFGLIATDYSTGIEASLA